MLKDVLTQLGTTSFVIAIAGYALKTWIAHQLERLKTQSAHELALKLETARSEWAKDVARLNVHESYLHKRRVDLIEEMYAEMVEAEFSLQNFLVSWWTHSNKEEITERGNLPNDHFVEGNTDSMEKCGLGFCEKFIKINATLHRNALFFDDSFIEGITGAYRPFFDTILALDYGQIPTMPEEFKDVVTVGRTPRLAVIDKFRAVLGVLQE
jgi:hypothetical protein